MHSKQDCAFKRALYYNKWRVRMRSVCAWPSLPLIVDCARALLHCSEEWGEFSLHTDGGASQAEMLFLFWKKPTTNCRISCVKRSGIAKNISRCAARTLYLTEPWSHARACWWKVNSRVLRQTAGEVKCSERAFRCSLIRLLVVRSHWE